MIAMSGMKKKSAALHEKTIVEQISTANFVKKVSVHIQSMVPAPMVVMAPIVTVTPIVLAESDIL